MSKIHYGVLLSIIILPAIAFGQTDRIQKRTIQIRNGSPSRYNSNYEKFAVKINPLLLLTGDIPVYAEYAVTDWCAIEAGVGITLEDYLRGTIEAFDDGDAYKDLPQKVVPRSSYSITAKLIPSTDVYDDAGYLGLYIGGRQYAKDYTVPSSNGRGSETLRTNTKTSDLGFVYGYYWTTDENNLYLDYYVGITIRSVTKTELVRDYASTFQGYTYSLDYNNGKTFGFLLGLKVGYLLF